MMITAYHYLSVYTVIRNITVYNMYITVRILTYYTLLVLFVTSNKWCHIDTPLPWAGVGRRGGIWSFLGAHDVVNLLFQMDLRSGKWEKHNKWITIEEMLRIPVAVVGLLFLLLLLVLPCTTWRSSETQWSASRQRTWKMDPQQLLKSNLASLC